ncbi:MAG TPA: hypothetical protein VF094_00260 [Gaiellaceae bacterium]
MIRIGSLVVCAAGIVALTSSGCGRVTVSTGPVSGSVVFSASD